MRNNSNILLPFLLCVVALLIFSCSKDEDDEDGSDYAYNDWLSYSKVKIKRYASGIKAHQSTAAYGDYAVFVTDRHTHFYFYNLKEKKYVFDLRMKTGSGSDYRGNTLYHSNQSSFGPDKYTEEDDFPLLYISQHAREDLRHFAEVFRIQAEWDDSLQEYKSFKANLVQTIYFPPMTNENSLGNINLAIDTLNRQMYTYSRNNNSGQENSGVCKITCFDLPESHTGDVYLEDSDIKSSFYIDSSAVNMQGGCIQDGILYIGRGMYSAGYIYLYAVNLEMEAEVARIDILSKLHHWEPEGCFFYNGCVMLSTTGGIWQFLK